VQALSLLAGWDMIAIQEMEFRHGVSNVKVSTVHAENWSVAIYHLPRELLLQSAVKVEIIFN